ncbi:hypothetical protein QYE76_059271 [Lolium multiflorum]|uniref:Secreted protein n=1 Tax=Lolium multiflorum TaxID=4521 RepID=A0AAD8VDG9_LOLMU|nr:hypothetical protein QYE76_059271 [Lolium multiflorum]
MAFAGGSRAVRLLLLLHLLGGGDPVPERRSSLSSTASSLARKRRSLPVNRTCHPLTDGEVVVLLVPRCWGEDIVGWHALATARTWLEDLRDDARCQGPLSGLGSLPALRVA